MDMKEIENMDKAQLKEAMENDSVELTTDEFMALTQKYIDTLED
jgi:hypothetical protein